MSKVYPSRRYNAKNENILVLSEEHEKSLVGEWADSPAKFGFIESPDPDAKPEAIKIELDEVAPRARKKKADKE